ncbi:MAG: hypothetical protein ABSF93_08990 [Candidatus Sulfotelmatobacter sp.]|jgi:hypothetical protein
MTLPLEYHISVRHSIPASLALFSLFALPVISVSRSHAQSNAAAASASSSKSSAHSTTGAPTSAATFGVNGHPHNPPITSKPTAPPSGDGQHHHVGYTPPAVYLVAVPYAIDIGATDDTADPDDSDANYQGGPTVFDRRGSGQDSYVRPVDPVPTPHAYDEADASAVFPEPPQEPAVLVFKDGRTLELGNYAIVGAILFDLTPGHSRKIALTDLDLDATRKQNDDRGISFQLPPPPQAN